MSNLEELKKLKNTDMKAKYYKQMSYRTITAKASLLSMNELSEIARAKGYKPGWVRIMAEKTNRTKEYDKYLEDNGIKSVSLPFR